MGPEREGPLRNPKGREINADPVKHVRFQKFINNRKGKTGPRVQALLGFFDKKWIYYELLKINDQKIPEMNASHKIFKLTGQMISKSCNLYIES